MDNSSKNQLGTEGCSSNESGWTMYLASPMQQDDDVDDQCSYDVIENYHYPVSKDEQDSDDSMASDASSGPHHLHHKQKESYQDHGGQQATSKSSKSISFNPFSSSATKPNKKDKKKNEVGTPTNDKNKRLTSNKRNK